MSVSLVLGSVWRNPGNRGRRARMLWRAAAWQLRKRILRRGRVLRLPNGVLFRAHPDCVISSALVYAAWPEYHELMLIRALLRPRDAVIDVGACVGHVSLLLADRVDPGNLVALEPGRVAWQRLRENWRLNGWPTANLHRCAAGARDGEAFVAGAERPLTTLRMHHAPAGERSERVPLRRLDGMRACRAAGAIGLLKIDVEGDEARVLEGAAGLLSGSRPRLVMFESLRGALDAEVGGLLRAHRYLPFQLDAAGRVDFSRLDNQNLLAVPQEQREVLARWRGC